MKFRWIGLILVSAAGLFAASSVSTNGITFVFDGDYTTGRFLDGEPWVVGPVSVTEMTPAYSNGDNGYEVNSMAPSKSLDSELGGFIEPDALPRTFPAGSSILKVSRRDFDNTNKSYLEQASVLTVLDLVPPANAFRPPYMGIEKPLYTADDILWGELPSLALLDSHQITTAAAESIFGGVWIDHQLGSVMDRRIHPCDAIRHVGGNPCAEYGAELARSLTSALLRCAQEGRSDQLVYDCIQTGLDMYYMHMNGMEWPANGGKFMGRKGAVMFAGKMLGIPELVAVGGRGTNVFQEDGQFYTGKTEALWGKPEPRDGAYWEYINTGSGGKDVRDPDSLRDGGAVGAEHCASPSPVNQCPQPTPEEQRNSGTYTMAGYQKIISNVTSGVAALVRVMDIEAEWDAPAFLSYADRIATPPWNFASTYGSAYLVEMYKAYGTETQSFDYYAVPAVSEVNRIQVFPSPMRDRVWFAGDVHDKTKTIRICDYSGSVVWESFIETRHVASLQWNGLTDTGIMASPGLYTYHIETSAGMQTGRIIKVE